MWRIFKNSAAAVALLGSSAIMHTQVSQFLEDTLNSPEATSISYSAFLNRAQSGELAHIIITKSGVVGRTRDGKEFTTAPPPNEKNFERLQGSPAEIWGADPNAPKFPVDPLFLAALMVGIAGAAQAKKAKDEFLANRAHEKEEAERQQSPYYQTALRQTAYHEAGHLLIGLLFLEKFDVKKATIERDSDSLGYVLSSLYSASFGSTKTDLEHDIMCYFGGMAAEEIIFGKDNTTDGVRGDLRNATNTAYSMVTRFGMSSLGPIMTIKERKFNTASYNIPGLGNILQKFSDEPNPALTPEMRNRINAEVEKILKDLYAKTLETFTQYKPQLEALANALLEHKTLTGEQARKIFEASLTQYPPATPSTQPT